LIPWACGTACSSNRTENNRANLTIPIFGDLHGDVPLEATGGALLVNLVVDKTLFAIIDVAIRERQ